jgi:hypothetical protein
VSKIIDISNNISRYILIYYNIRAFLCQGVLGAIKERGRRRKRGALPPS